MLILLSQSLFRQNLQGILKSCSCISRAFLLAFPCVYCFVLLSLTIGMSTINLQQQQRRQQRRFHLNCLRHVKWSSNASWDLHCSSNYIADVFMSMAIVANNNIMCTPSLPLPPESTPLAPSYLAAFYQLVRTS